MVNIDYNGVALVLGAIGVLLASIGSFVVQMVGLSRQTANKQDTDRKLEVLHEQGNSNLETARKLSEALGVEKGKQIGSTNAKAEGKAEGIKEERANPMVPASVVVNVPATPDMPLPLPVVVVEPDYKPPAPKK